MFDVSFIVHQAGMDTALLLLLGFDHHSPRASVCLFRSVYDPSLRKFVAACFGLDVATVFGPFRKNDDQLCFLIDNSMCHIVITELPGGYRRLTPHSNFCLAFC